MCRQAHSSVVSRTTDLPNIRTEANKRRNVIESMISQNVRGLKSDERLEELFAAMKARNVLAVCLQET